MPCSGFSNVSHMRNISLGGTWPYSGVWICYMPEAIAQGYRSPTQDWPIGNTCNAILYKDTEAALWI